MPFYEYQCRHCGHHHEAMQKMTDPHLKRCPACGRSALKRLVSAAAFRLKGAGWYETDFKKSSEDKRNLLAADQPDKTDQAGKSEPAEKADQAAKPEATADQPVPAATEAKSAAAPAKAPATSTGTGTATGASAPRTRGGRVPRGGARARRAPRR